MKASPPILSKYRNLQLLEHEIEGLIKTRQRKLTTSYIRATDYDDTEQEIDELKESLDKVQVCLISLASTFSIED